MSETVIATCAFPGTYDINKSLELHLSYIEEAGIPPLRAALFDGRERCRS